LPVPATGLSLEYPLVTADRVFRDRVVERFPNVRLLKGIEPQ
jgi:hypothetical protein